jgi:hypothetical protein
MPAEKEKIVPLPSVSKVTDLEPRLIKFEINDLEYFEVSLRIDATMALIFKATEIRDEGDYDVLQASVLDSYKAGEAFNDVVLQTFVGTNSFNDKLAITFHTKTDEDKDIELGKEYDREQILAGINRKDLKEKLDRGLTEAYIQTAYLDIDAARKGIIAPVNANMPIKYHEIHFEYEQRVFKDPGAIPNRDIIPLGYNKLLLKIHMQAHQLVYKHILKGEPIPEDWYKL